MIIAVIYATFAVAERKPEKNSGLYRIRILDLNNTGAALYQLSCVYNCGDHPSFNSSLCSSHIWFSYIHNFIIILSQVYNEPIQRPAPSWLVSLIGRALHRYHRGQGFESRTSLNFFQAFFSQLQKLGI